MYFIIGTLIWWLIGMLSFIYFESKEEDLYIDDIIFSMAVGIFGPIVLMGCLTSNMERIIIKKRK